jgi:hypothetical protein
MERCPLATYVRLQPFSYLELTLSPEENLSMAPSGRERLLREVNDRIAEAARIFGAERPVVFMCECGSRACMGSVELTLDEFASRGEHGPIVAVGHAVSAVVGVPLPARQMTRRQPCSELCHAAERGPKGQNAP